MTRRYLYKMAMFVEWFSYDIERNINKSQKVFFFCNFRVTRYNVSGVLFRYLPNENYHPGLRVNDHTVEFCTHARVITPTRA